MPIKKKVVVELENGKRIILPQPKNINIDFKGVGVKPYNFDLNINRHDLRNLEMVLKKLKKPRLHINK